MLALATLDKPNLLILDEPTNHLDIDARGELLNALNDFDGAVVLVSHDRRLIEATADRLLLVANGEVRAVRRRSRRLPPVPAVGRQHAERRPRSPSPSATKEDRPPQRRREAPAAEAAQGQGRSGRTPDRGADSRDRQARQGAGRSAAVHAGSREGQRRLQEARRRRAQTRRQRKAMAGGQEDYENALAGE